MKRTEAALRQSIDEKRKRILTLKSELTNLEGRLLNRDPLIAQKIQKKNDELKLRMLSLEKALFALLQESARGRSLEEEKTRYDVVRKAAVDYLKANNAEAELWKNLES